MQLYPAIIVFLLCLFYFPPVVRLRLSLKNVSLDVERKDFKLQSCPRHTLFWEEKTFTFVLAIMTSFLNTFRLLVSRSRPWYFGLPRGPFSFFVACRGWMAVNFVIFIFSVFVISLVYAKNLEHVVPLHRKPSPTLACRGRSSVDPNHYALTGHPNPLNSIFSLLHDAPVHRCYDFIPRFGSFAAQFRLYTLVRLVVYYAPRCSGSANASGFCFPFCLLLFDGSAQRCFVPPVLWNFSRSALIITLGTWSGISWGGCHIRP